MSSRPLAVEFVASASRVDQLPPSDAEVAFVGRSNVGKSSLINAVAHRRQLARVSNTPGRTQLINFFRVGDGGTLVDLPGYGYAKVPGRIRAGWADMIEGYLLEREELTMIFVLVDGEIGPTTLDSQMLDWLRSNELPHTVVATKMDKVKSSKKRTRKRDLAARCDLEVADIVWVSSANKVNIDRVRDLVRTHLEV
ncbi:MAG: YihA family ribosome biogenesis GTP-binding protein [Ilumatobacter coccineus]|uniref:Probable GTP-binding protein EngB n=1 Tax=Ilumatobacter coccineus TaxID=467094 RepID=A0A2G6K876_9ACTN|nr:MAG: YihA family ribosome biogenesis GTP-binding protein [Ilumatobacter coccineus]